MKYKVKKGQETVQTYTLLTLLDLVNTFNYNFFFSDVEQKLPVLKKNASFFLSLIILVSLMYEKLRQLFVTRKTIATTDEIQIRIYYCSIRGRSNQNKTVSP